LKGILFLQDNAAPHKAAITHQKLADLHCEALMKHPAYSPDVAPSGYCLFSNLKKHLKGRTISNSECGRVVCSKAKRIFLGWVKEVRTMNRLRV
jgi:hypothetical protein